jgi:hypothetical protein
MSGNSLVDATLGLIEKGEDTMFTRSSMGDGKTRKDGKDDTGHKKGKQPDSTGGKAEKMGKLREAKSDKKKQGWMAKMEKIANKRSDIKPGKIDWDTATHLFNTGKSPEDAAKANIFKS